MKVNELRELSVAELKEKLNELLREQFTLRMQRSSDQLNQTHLFKQARRNIARVKTLITEAAKKS